MSIGTRITQNLRFELKVDCDGRFIPPGLCPQRLQMKIKLDSKLIIRNKLIVMAGLSHGLNLPTFQNQNIIFNLMKAQRKIFCQDGN